MELWKIFGNICETYSLESHMLERSTRLDSTGNDILELSKLRAEASSTCSEKVVVKDAVLSNLNLVKTKAEQKKIYMN